MADFTPPFANAATRREPTVGEINGGFPCGPLDQDLWNWLVYAYQAEIGNVIDWSGQAPSNADFEQLRKAIQQMIQQESPSDNLLINPEFDNDQRNVGSPTGAKAYKAYIRDRWRAGPVGITSGVFTGPTLTLNGAVEQIVEAPALAGEVVTVCVDDPSGTVAVTLTDGTNTASGNITAGAGIRSVTLTVPAGLSGDLTCRLSTASAISFVRPRLVRGNRARPFVRRPYAIETTMCHRYYWIPGRKPISEVNVPPTGVDGSIIGFGQATSGVAAVIFMPFHVKMRTVPTFVITAPSQFQLLNGSGTPVGPCTALTLGSPATNRDAGLVSCSIASGLTAGQGCLLQWVTGTGSNFAFDAEFN